MTSSSFRQTRRTVYALKRAYGQLVTLCRTTNNIHDPTTGKMTETLIKLDVRRAALLPARSVRDFAYDLSFIAANKNFTYGAYFDHKVRLILVSRRDVTAPFIVNLNMHIIFGGLRYEVKEIFEYEDAEALVYVADALSAAPVMDQKSVSAGNNITFGQSAVAT